MGPKKMQVKQFLNPAETIGQLSQLNKEVN